MLFVMPKSAVGKMAIAFGLSLLASHAALAFDPKAGNDPSVCCDEATETAMRAATRAYYSGEKSVALTGLLAAAQSGHPAAQWKLGRMYADGDGVTEDDYKAFQYFSTLVNSHGEDSPASPEAPFVASAFVQIGSYYLTGISNSTVQPNVDRARQIFTYAASYFGDASAQYNLGRMYLEGEGGERDPRQAARWFLLAARKGQIGAQTQLGEMLVRGDQIDPNAVQGLMWLTIALKRSSHLGINDGDIRAAHEDAFALASEDDRRRAIALADRWLAENDPSFGQDLAAR